MEITFPWPPTINTYWRSAYIKNHVMVYISRDGKAYREEVGRLVRQKRPIKLLGRLNVDITAHPPDRRARDLDNLLKALLDAMAHADVYHDDGQIDELYIRRSFPTEGGNVCVVVREISDLATVEDRAA